MFTKEGVCRGGGREAIGVIPDPVKLIVEGGQGSKQTPKKKKKKKKTKTKTLVHLQGGMVAL